MESSIYKGRLLGHVDALTSKSKHVLCNLQGSHPVPSISSFRFYVGAMSGILEERCIAGIWPFGLSQPAGSLHPGCQLLHGLISDQRLTSIPCFGQSLKGLLMATEDFKNLILLRRGWKNLRDKLSPTLSMSHAMRKSLNWYQ